jgi:hypothetical protein
VDWSADERGDVIDEPSVSRRYRTVDAERLRILGEVEDESNDREAEGDPEHRFAAPLDRVRDTTDHDSSLKQVPRPWLF